VNNRLLSSLFSTAIILSGLLLVNTAQLITVQASTEVAGMISSDTTWTKANSPYTLVQPLTVNSGIILAIESGVTIIMNQNVCLQVDGTIVARGTDPEKIIVNGGEIRLTPNSTGWNEQTASGSIIENVIFNDTTITVGNSAKINNNTIIGVIDAVGGSPHILNNAIYGSLNNEIYGSRKAINICGGSPQIKHNHLVGGINGNSSARFPIISNNYVVGQVAVRSGSPVISNNTITGIISLSKQLPLVNNGSVQLESSDTNYISTGIGLTGYNFGDEKLYGAVVTDNIIIGCLTGICWNAGGGAIIARNFIANCSREGLAIGANAIIANNTIRNSSIGIKLFNFNGINDGPSEPQFPPTILNNNIENNAHYNMYSGCTIDLNATYYWWGTTDTTAISQSIHDFEDYSNLGKITFIPFLTSPNLNAAPDPNAPIPTPLTTPTPSPTDSPSPTATPTPSTIPVPGQSVFFVESNSTITELFFNSTSSELSFTVNGPTGTTGYVKVTIAKSLVSSIQNVKVYLDGNQLNVAITEDGDAWLLSFTYTHSTHKVLVSLATEQGPQPLQSEIIVNAVIIAVILGLVVVLLVGGIKRK